MQVELSLPAFLFLLISLIEPFKIKNSMRIFICALLCSFFVTAQQIEIVDFLKAEATIEPIYSRKTVRGTVKYRFKILQKTDSIYLDAIHMKIMDTALEGPRVSISDDKIWLLDSFETNKEYTVFFEYEANPKQAVYFFEDQIWTQGQGKYTSHWLPSIDDMNDKIEFDLTFKVLDTKTTISNGKLDSVLLKDGMAFWKWDMDRPMSSYLVAFIIGNFENVTELSRSQVPIKLYYDPVNVSCVEPTYRFTKEIFDFLEEEIGIPYPWQNYKQVPVRDFLYAGMENTTATIFSKSFVVDSIGFVDRNYVYVNAHELAHQWFGNFVTETDSAHHWLHEGFATYYALLAEKEMFGDDHFYYKLLQSADQLSAMSADGKGESLLNASASSLTFYEKGAWALHILKELIGEKSFKKGVQLFLKSHEYRNVNTKDFLDAIGSVSNVDISNWEQEWLLEKTFNREQAYISLKRSSFINDLLRLKEFRKVDLTEKTNILLDAMTHHNDIIAQEAIYQVSKAPTFDAYKIYQKGFESNSVLVRQAIALTMNPIPDQFILAYESLLNDKSYLTKEAAFFRLWVDFPEHRTRYLDLLKNVNGFQDKNVRQLWLALAFLTDEYNPEFKHEYLKELKGYSSSKHSFEIREKAIEYLVQLELIDREVLINLINASTHPSWRFRKYARSQLKQLLLEDTYSQIALSLIDQLSVEEGQYLNSILKPN